MFNLKPKGTVAPGGEEGADAEVGEGSGEGKEGAGEEKDGGGGEESKEGEEGEEKQRGADEAKEGVEENGEGSDEASPKRSTSTLRMQVWCLYSSRTSHFLRTSRNILS